MCPCGPVLPVEGELMDPTVLGALIGVGGGVVGAVVTGLFTASSAVRAVRQQAREQRMEGLWQMRRDAYSALLTSIERTRAAIRRYEGAALAPAPGSEEWSAAVAAAREGVEVVQAEMMHQGTIFRISVTALEADSAESLVSVVNGVVSNFDVWVAALGDGHEHARELRRFALNHLDGLPRTLEHFMECSKGYVHHIPGAEPPGPSLGQRWRSWLLERRLRGMGD